MCNLKGILDTNFPEGAPVMSGDNARARIFIKKALLNLGHRYTCDTDVRINVERLNEFLGGDI